MLAKLLIDGKEPSPTLGIVEATLDEGINRISQMDIILVSTRPDVSLDDKIGKKATITLKETWDGQDKVSRFDGLIFQMGRLDTDWSGRQYFAYGMLVRPAVWKLSHTLHSRVFSNKKLIDMVNQVLSEDGLAGDVDYKHQLLRTSYPEHEQIIQYSTSDLDFISERLAEEGVNYFFSTDTTGQNQQAFYMVDDRSLFADPFGGKAVPYGAASGMIANGRHVATFQSFRNSVPGTVNVAATRLLNPTQSFQSSGAVSGGLDTAMDLLGGIYAGDASTVESIAQKRANLLKTELTSRSTGGEGTSNMFLFRPGSRFSMDPAPQGQKGVEQLLTRVRHRLYQSPGYALQTDRGDAEYGNEFTTVPVQQDYTPENLSRLLPRD